MINTPRATLNLPCFELCVGICESLIAETGIGAIACVIGCAIACDSDTAAAGQVPHQD